jgi:hypothetical protein
MEERSASLQQIGLESGEDGEKLTALPAWPHEKRAGAVKLNKPLPPLRGWR